MGDQSKPSIIHEPPKGLENNFPKWSLISSEMLSMQSKTTSSSNTKDLMNFLFRLPLATLWKNLELQSRTW